MAFCAGFVCVLKSLSAVRDYLLPTEGDSTIEAWHIVLVAGSCVKPIGVACLHHCSPCSLVPVLQKVQKRTEAKIGSITQKETGMVTLHGLVLEDGSCEDLETQETPQSHIELTYST